VAAYITGLTALIVVVCAAVFTGLAGQLPVGVFAAVLVGAPLISALRQLAIDIMERKQRTRHLTQAGRMVEQIAHDLRNPTAALKAAIQYVQVEQQRGLASSTLTTYLDLMHGQVERIAKVIDGYLRVARVVALRSDVSVNDLAAECARRHREAIRTDLAPDLPKVLADPDLLVAALDNLVINAIEASEPQAPIILTTSMHSDAGGDVIEISVEDHGHGMDPRQLESAFDEFFTTKPGGSGLGLSFAQRVMEAHGGTVLLTSTLGRGTVATLHIPHSTD
jgi:signal transduction histidine kinase